jgi:hypothetical protein
MSPPPSTPKSHGPPGPDELAPFYTTYTRLVPAADIRATLAADQRSTGEFFAGLTEAQADHRYAAGKWSVREVIGHIIDAEWVFGQRALWISRGVDIALPGMEQDDFAAGANYAAVPLGDLRAQFDHLRSAGLLQYATFTDAMLLRRGTASGTVFSVRALLYIICGHARHHLEVIRQRYL